MQVVFPPCKLFGELIGNRTCILNGYKIMVCTQNILLLQEPRGKG
jgi:hypothetical protein